MKKLLLFVQDFLGLAVGEDTNLFHAGMDSMQLVMLSAYLELELGAPPGGPPAAHAQSPTTILRWVRQHTGR